MTSSPHRNVASWLAHHALSGGNNTAAVALHLFHHLLTSPDARERTAAQETIAWRGEIACVTQWLATQVLSASKRAPGVKAAKICLLNLMMHESPAERRAAEQSLIWMVLHTRPKKLLAPEDQATLLPQPHGDGTDWAASMLDKDLIRPLLKQGRWWHRCRFAQSKFGFDFADEGVNFVWERIEDYRDQGRGFRAWVETILGNYWTDLHRKWKRTIPKDSDAAKELESLAVGDDERWTKADAKIGTYPNSGTPMNNRNGPDICFSASDVAVMARWEPLDGVLMGFETDLWRRIPRELWDAWLNRLKISPRMFGGAIANMTPLARRELLATITGIKINTLAQRWKRIKPRLATLESVSALRAAVKDAD